MTSRLQSDRRSLLMMGATGLLATPLLAAGVPAEGWVNVRHFGAKGDGSAIDTPAINKAIDYAAARGGGTVYFPAGTYACYSIRLKSRVGLHLDSGAIILAAKAPEGGAGGYDLAEPQDPSFEPYQDYGHNHWRNSLIWGDGLADIAITGDGLIWGKGLGRGSDGYRQDPAGPGTGNKTIALKNCHNVLLRDFKILEGGWFGLLLTGVDNLTIDNLLIDTNRDGIDIDCCRNVRVSNCTVNSPFDDGICPKSSFALGYPRSTENLTIENCMVTGSYEIGSVLAGTWKKRGPEAVGNIYGRIKLGTESNGGFKSITITNCTFDGSQGLALETVDGANLEDVTISNITMRGSVSSPIFMRLGRRMRGPKGRPIGTLKRVMISNVSSSGASLLPSIIAGLPDHPVEDIKISDVYLQQVGGAPEAMAHLNPPANEDHYPEPYMFGDLPASGFFIRHARNVEFSNVEVAVQLADPRPAYRIEHVDGADFFHVRAPGGATFSLEDVRNFTVTGSGQVPDQRLNAAQSTVI